MQLDPRIKLSPRSVLQQSQVEMRLAGLLSRSSEDVLQARSVLEQIGRLGPKLGALKDQADRVAAQVTALLAGPKPNTARAPTLRDVNASIATLYGVIQVDAQPTAAQLTETTKTETTATALAGTWTKLKTGELATLDAALKAAGLPEIRPELRPMLHPTHSNEE